MKTEQPRTIYLKDYSPPDFLIDDVELTVRLNPSETHVHSRLHLRPNPDAKKQSKKLVLNGEHLKLLGLRLNGQALDASAYNVTAELLTIPNVPDEPFTLEVQTSCNPESNKALTGLYRSNGTYCTQCEAEGFRRVTYYLDRPDVLAKFRVRIEASKKEAPVLLSNGNLIESGELAHGRHFAVWEDPFPKPCYLFALVAGKLACVSDSFKTRSGRDVALHIYVEPGKEDRCGWAMESLKRSMKWDEERFGLEYDLDMFMIVAVSDFNMGAMENKGLNIFNDALVLARPETATDNDYERVEGVIAHEYFHNWTGNRVTCRDWFQLCLKEGLTVFRDQEFTADVRSPVVKRIQDVRLLKYAQFREDAGPLAHPVRPASFIEINNFYTATVYEKGAEICRMLQTVLGRDGFRKGLDLYFRKFDGQAVTVEDFIGAMAEANGVELGDFMLWYNQAGTPEVEARHIYSQAMKSLKLTLSQSYPETPDGEKRKPVPIPVKLGFIGQDGTELPVIVDGSPVKDGVVYLRKKKETFTFEGLDEKPAVSLLRHFSAPVNLKAPAKPRDMLTLIRFDSDLFNRWQTAQSFALEDILGMTRAFAAGETPRADPRYIAALGEVLGEATLDPGYRATFLLLPTETDIALAIGRDVDPEAIFNARRTLRVAIGKRLGKPLKALYDGTVPRTPFSPDATSAGLRALRNAIMSILVAGGSRYGIAQAKTQARAADNMTDTMAALSALLDTEGDALSVALGRFERRWKHDALVMNKWFQLQAWSPRPDVFDRIEDLSKSPHFSIKNPNRVRALYNAFAYNNQLRFNDKSGRGYRLVADAVMEIDGFNPQVAARLVGAFESWRMFESGRRSLAEKELSRILHKPSLSKDVLEKVEKITAAA